VSAGVPVATIVLHIELKKEAGKSPGKKTGKGGRTNPKGQKSEMGLRGSQSHKYAYSPV